MEDRPNGAIGSGPAATGRALVVCCVQGDAAPLQPAFDVLSLRGYTVAIIEGTHVGPPALAEHAQRHGPDALYVLAKMSECSEATLIPLEAALRREQVPASHISEVAADWRDPMALVEHVQSVASALPQPPQSSRATAPPMVRTSAPSPTAGRRETTGPQRVVTAAPAPATGPQPTVAPKQTTGPQRTVVAPPSSRKTLPHPSLSSRPTTGPQRAVGPAPPLSGPHRTVIAPPPASEERELTEPAPAREIAAPAVAPADEIIAPAASTTPTLVPSTATVVAPAFPAPQAMSPVMSPATGVEPALSEPPASPPTMAAAAQRLRAVTAALRPLAAMTGSGSRRAIAWVAASRNRMLAVGGGAFAMLVLVVALSVGDDDATAGATAASDPPTTATLAGTAAEVAGPGAPAEAGARPSSPATPSDAAADRDAAADEPDAAEAGAAPEAADIAVEDAPAAAPNPRARPQIGTHGDIVFAPLHSPKRTFRKAKQMCDDMNAGETHRWRMPTLAELHALAIAHAIDRGVYWSGTEADAFGSRALVWSEKKTTAAPITKAWGGARALCVRDENAAQ
jgi:hypothetical protein